MHFDLVDRVLHQTDDSIVTIKAVTNAEEYLQDHFPSFPVLPGVMMIEALAQAARTLLAHQNPHHARHVLGSVRALKYASFVRPGEALRVEVSLQKRNDDHSVTFKGAGSAIPPDDAEPRPCVSGRFTLRPINTTPDAPAQPPNHQPANPG